MQEDRVLNLSRDDGVIENLSKAFGVHILAFLIWCWSLAYGLCERCAAIADIKMYIGPVLWWAQKCTVFACNVLARVQLYSSRSLKGQDGLRANGRTGDNTV